MKRQRSYGDGLDDDRRRFYDRGPPPPPSRRPPREYEGDRFDRRRGFGGGSNEYRYREYPSPREYGGDRALHRSESFSGFRREFPKGFRSERDRPRRDGDGSSTWRRPGAGWRDAEGPIEHRVAARLSGAPLSVPPRLSRSRSRSRSPIEPRRRLEVARAEKLRKQSVSIGEMEEGEVAPDAEHKARPAAIEHRKQVQPSRARQKGPERGEVKKVESGVLVDSGSRCKGVTGASHSDNAASEEGNINDVVVPEAGEAMDKGRQKSALKPAEECEGRHEAQPQDAATSVAGEFGLSTSPMQQEKVKPQEEATETLNGVDQITSSSILMEVIEEEKTTRAETTHDIDEIGKSDSSSLRQGATPEEVAVLYKAGRAGDEASIMRQEVRQEQSLVLDGTGFAVDEVGKSVSSSVAEEVLQEEVTQHDTTASAVDGAKIGTSGMLQETMQDKITIPDEITNIVNNPELVSFSSLMKDAMHTEGLTLDGMASTTGVAGQFNPSESDKAEDVMQEKAVVLEGVTNAVDVAEDNNMSTGLQGEVVACLHQQDLKNKESENVTVMEEKVSEPTECVASRLVEEGAKMYHCEKIGASAPVETTFVEGVVVMHENVEKQVKMSDVEVKTETVNVFLQPTKEHAEGSKEEASSANVMTRGPGVEDKGNDIAFDVLSKEENVDLTEPVGRGFDSTLQLCMEPTETSKLASTTSLKQEHGAIDIGKLDLSLSLSGCLQNSESKSSASKTCSRVHATSSQLLPSSSFRTNSDGFIALESLTNSQTLAQNPSCSLTQQALEKYENSVGSKPLFAGVDQVSSYAGWQAQLSSESTQKGGASPLLQRVQQNGHVPDNTSAVISGLSNGMSKDLHRLASFPGVSSPMHGRGSHDPGLEHSRFRRQLTRERSSSSLTRGGQQEGEQLSINGSGVVERVISKVVSEPFHHTARMLQEMTENSIRYLRDAISKIIVDPDKRGQIIALQEALKKRPDLNSDMLRTCPQLLMEILVAIRTGLPYFIKKNSGVASSDLVEIFLNLKCCNISCQSVLPVDDCDCKICRRKTGFCSSCMCIVCSKFDSASNTCSWVGCDVCLHWCHTDCGLRHSLIRKGQSSSRAYDTMEMQFHCAACGHPSEMFGFVKEVFRTCARQWMMDTLVRELRCVERIFYCSDDARGKRVWNFVKQMLIKLENKACYPEVVKSVITFFSDDDANLGIGPSEPLRGIPCSIAEAVDGIPSSSRTIAWKPYTLEGLPVLEKGNVHSTTGSSSLHRKSGEAEFHADDSKPVIDELDNLVRLKQAEAYMYQERANEARNQADDLKHIVMVKTAQIEEYYATQMAELNINELQERRKQKIEELQVSERAHRQFFSMKTRMEASIRELLLKMELMEQH